MAQLSLNQVSKSYGKTNVLYDINLDVEDGEFIVIVGPSGCGKSSLLRMVAGLEEITQGEISIDGRVINTVEPKDRDVAMVFQNYALYPHMSVFKNMAYGLTLRGVPKAEIQQRVQQTAKLLQLEDLLTRKPRELSGGQRQRVAMGRAIIREPAVFLFDEPLSNLDAKLRVTMRLEIRALQRRLNVTSLYVTHDQVEAMTLADRLVVLNEGRAEQIDTPINVYERPATQYVAGFIGTPAMNFLPGEISAEGTTITLASGSSLKYSKLLPAEHFGRSIIVGIRPEKLMICPPAQADFTGTVQAIETLGAETLAHCAFSSNTTEQLIAKLPGDRHLTEGEQLPLQLANDSIHLFCRSKGQRLRGT
ncbi:MAG: sn-glycerol-3-phosphate import ATP-binding protein UgpC [Pseudomonadota bacterium]